MAWSASTNGSTAGWDGTTWRDHGDRVASALLITLGTLGHPAPLHRRDARRSSCASSPFAELAVLLGVVFSSCRCGQVVRRCAAGCTATAPRTSRRGLAHRARHCRSSSCGAPRSRACCSWPLPVSVFAVVELSLPFYSVAFLLLGGLVAIGYSGGAPLLLRRVGAQPGAARPRRRAAAGLRGPARGRAAALEAARRAAADQRDHRSGGQRPRPTARATRSRRSGSACVVALVVAFTISLELTVLVSRSVLRPVQRPARRDRARQAAPTTRCACP